MRYRSVMTKDKAKKLGLTERERTSYNYAIVRTMLTHGLTYREITMRTGIDQNAISRVAHARDKSVCIDFDRKQKVLRLIKKGYRQADIQRILDITRDQYYIAINSYSKKTIREAMAKGDKTDMALVYKIIRYKQQNFDTDLIAVHLNLPAKTVKKIEKKYQKEIERNLKTYKKFDGRRYYNV